MAVALGDDDVDGVEGFGHPDIMAGPRVVDRGDGVEGVGPERLGQHLAHRAARPRASASSVSGEPFSHSSWRQRPHGIRLSPFRSTHADRDQRAAAGACSSRHHAALGAQRDAVGRVLDVAPRHDAPVVDQPGDADGEVAVGRVGEGRHPHRLGAQRLPVDRLLGCRHVVSSSLDVWWPGSRRRSTATDDSSRAPKVMASSSTTQVALVQVEGRAAVGARAEPGHRAVGVREVPGEVLTAQRLRGRHRVHAPGQRREPEGLDAGWRVHHGRHPLDPLDLGLHAVGLRRPRARSPRAAGRR